MITAIGDTDASTKNSEIRRLASNNESQKSIVDIETLLKFQKMIDVEMIADPEGGDSGEERVQLNKESGRWRIANFIGDQMDIQLDFAKPTGISATGNDLVSITFRNTLIIYDWLGREVEKGTVLEKYVPA